MRCLQIWVHAWIRWSGFTNKPEFNWRSVADSVVQFLGCEGQIYVSSRKSWFYRFMKRKTVQTKYDVPVRRAFRWASEQKFCEAELHEIFRIPAPWLTKEIIFVCTVFLSFTLRMTCERTLISAQFTLWIAPQNLQFTLWNFGWLWLLPLVTWIHGFSQLGYCMLHSLG